MTSNMELLRRLIKSMSDSPFVQGTAKNCADSLLKLLLLKRFGIISDDYYDYQIEAVNIALEELYNCKISNNNLENANLKIEVATDWQDSLSVSKDMSHIMIENISKVVKDAYVENKTVKLFGIHTNELLHARVRSYNGEAYAIDLLDTENNLYTISDSVIVNEIVQKRKFTFDNTYGFISSTCDSPVELSDVLLAVLQNKKHRAIYKLRFMAYNDIFSMSREIAYDNVDIYNIKDITEWLRKDSLSLNSLSNIVVYMEVVNGEETQAHLLIINRNTSKIGLTVKNVVIQLDKFSERIIQRLKICNNDNIAGELILPYEDENSLVAEETYLFLSFDIIADKFNWSKEEVLYE